MATMTFATATITRELIYLDLIDPNPWQPRQDDDLSKLLDLADSLYHIGLLQVPLGRRTTSGRIQSAFGHRRIGAVRLLHQVGLWAASIGMDIAEISDEEMAVIALAENEKLAQLTKIEVVRAHKRALDETELSIQSLADQLGIARATLSNNLRVLELPDFVLEHVASGDLSLSVAREFLVLQNADHAHTDDMQSVVNSITSRYTRSGPPDWTRRKVRDHIGNRVTYNDKEYRPLGPRPGYAPAGAGREATFDVDAFAAEHPDQLYTIPASNGYGANHDSSRLWTCAVKDWTRAQTRATREANKGGRGPSSPDTSRNDTREKRFQRVLSQDPVMKEIAKTRDKKGPARPVTDDERERLGTRAEMRETSYQSGFWKILQKGDPENVRDWSRANGGGHVPPSFLDLSERQKCTVGATYAMSRDGYLLDKPTLACFNKEHYLEKLKAGEAAYWEKLEAQRKGNDRQDRKATQELIRQLATLSDETCRSLLVSLVTVESPEVV